MRVELVGKLSERFPGSVSRNELVDERVAQAP
jgi:hypothetical protein